MPQDDCVTDSQHLRQRLTAADPMERAMGLHALEIEVGRCPARGSLVQEASRFAERGIPYYSLQDPHFQDWVGRCVSYWEKLHAGQGPATGTKTAPTGAVARRVGA